MRFFTWISSDEIFLHGFPQMRKISDMITSPNWRLKKAQVDNITSRGSFEYLLNSISIMKMFRMRTNLGWTAEGCNQRVSILAPKSQWQPMTRSSTLWLLTIRWPVNRYLEFLQVAFTWPGVLCIHPGCLHPSWYPDIAILTRRTPFLLNWSFGPRRPWSEVPLESLGSGGDEPVILMMMMAFLAQLFF